eukprot:15409276-Alexandrium_andersonii.AAC.1
MGVPLLPSGGGLRAAPTGDRGAAHAPPHCALRCGALGCSPPWPAGCGAHGALVRQRTARPMRDRPLG